VRKEWRAMKLVKTLEKYLIVLVILMLINDVIQAALAYRDYKKRMNRLAFKRLARMRKKAIQRAQSRTQS
jgi:hypothetical protein